MPDLDASRKDGKEMEPSRFDDLTKALATATSRRQALKTIAATTLGGILGLSGIGTALADKTCKKLGQGCNNKKNLCCPGLICQGGICVTCTANEGTCTTNSDCCSGNCSNGICCGSGRVGLCNGSCAKPCQTRADCSGCGDCGPDQASGVFYCGGPNTNGIPCESTCGICPRGTYCESDNLQCTVLC